MLRYPRPQAVFLLIGKTSALTMNIAGVIKDWMLIFFSWYLFRAPVTTLNLLGYAFCCRSVCVPALVFEGRGGVERAELHEGGWHTCMDANVVQVRLWELAPTTGVLNSETAAGLEGVTVSSFR